MLNELLKGIKLSSGGDVIPTAVQLTDLVMLHVVPLDLVPVSDGQRVSAWTRFAIRKISGVCPHSRTLDNTVILIA